MSRLIIALAAVAILAGVASPAHAWPFRQRVVQRQVIVQKQVAVRQQVVVQKVVAQPVVQAFYAQPVVAVQPVVQSYCAPASIVAPVYGQQVIQAQSACFFAR